MKEAAHFPNYSDVIHLFQANRLDLTWLCWLSWLLNVTVRLVAALGVLLLANMFFPFSKALHLRLHMSMFWKQDFTLL